jgi:tyrosinase
MRIRRSLTDLEREYEAGTKGPLEELMRAWKGVKELPWEDQRSFFKIGGFHGEPFRGAGWGVGDGLFWGGYCHHGNVLFPLWHRAYLYALETALRSIPRCGNVTIPFWDECSKQSLTHGIPWSLTRAKFTLDGQTIDNPLRSFVFPANIVDRIDATGPNYSKPKGYETVRYPYSGLVGTPLEVEETRQHNERWTYPEAEKVLNENIIDWLTTEIVVRGKTVSTGVYKAFSDCLQAPNYTVFSNVTSAAAWGDNSPKPVVALENPHNKIHLAVGGYDAPGGHRSVIFGANGDMGENDTAGLDPIFYFHHCFIDRMFWLWQLGHNATKSLEIIDQYPGTNSSDEQGATPGIPPNTWLNLQSPLEPFKWKVGGAVRTIVGDDLINIEEDLEYKYGPGSFDVPAEDPLAAEEFAPGPRLHVTGIDRGGIRGSFLIVASAHVEGEWKVLGSEAVLSRWHVAGCANCRTHQVVGASFPLHGLDAEEVGATVQVEVRTHDGPLGDGPRGLSLAQGEGSGGVQAEQQGHFRLELR